MRGAERLLGAVSVYGLTRTDTLRPEQAARLSELLALQVFPSEPLRVREPWQPEYLHFLHALAADLTDQSNMRVLLTSLGLPTRLPGVQGWVGDTAFGEPVAAYFADEERQAEFVAESLPTLQQAGAAGVWLAAYADVPETLWQVPPFDRSLRSRSLGIVRADRSEKPACAALRQFARSLPPTADLPPRASLGLDNERYWRDPLADIRRLR
ncbi:MAG: hypothetical protein HC828_10760 [Blastochloris sp.]|nr:hypothetical protein [Blastochloris sp.]